MSHWSPRAHATKARSAIPRRHYLRCAIIAGLLSKNLGRAAGGPRAASNQSWTTECYAWTRLDAFRSGTLSDIGRRPVNGSPQAEGSHESGLSSLSPSPARLRDRRNCLAWPFSWARIFSWRHAWPGDVWPRPDELGVCAPSRPRLQGASWLWSPERPTRPGPIE